jgi:hypothetical protein
MNLEKEKHILNLSTRSHWFGSYLTFVPTTYLITYCRSQLLTKLGCSFKKNLICVLLSNLQDQRVVCWTSKKDLGTQQSVAKFIPVMNLVIPKAEAKRKLLFNKPTSGNNIYFIIKQATIMRRSTVLSLPAQLVFPGLTFAIRALTAHLSLRDIFRFSFSTSRA